MRGRVVDPEHEGRRHPTTLTHRWDGTDSCATTLARTLNQLDVQAVLGTFAPDDTPSLRVDTPEGPTRARPGDWIVLCIGDDGAWAWVVRPVPAEHG